MNIAIKNLNGMDENVSVVRYFQFNGTNYLIFTKNEVDESGYQKLYISKIANMVGNTITDEIEWNLLRDTIKVVAKANKENTTLPVQDLNDSDANGIQIMGEKPFKLTSASVALLSANKASSVTNNLNSMPSVVGATPAVTPIGNNTQLVTPVVNNVPTPVSPIVDAVTSPIINNSIPADINSGIMNNNFLQSDNLQSQIVPPVTNASFVPTEPIEFQNVNSNLMQDSIVSTPVAVPSTVAQTTVPTANEISMNMNASNFSVNPGDNNLQQGLYSDLQPLNNVNVENLGNSVVTPAAVEPQVPVEPTVDYKKLYEEQTLKLNAITVELDKYKNIVEQLKNILN